MTESQFWQLVTATNPCNDSDTLSTELTDKLQQLSDNELAAFDKLFNLKMRDSYTWSIWGAAFIISGCNSEFAFAEFRCWLVSRGEKAFNLALKNPDSLVDVEIYINQDKFPHPYLEEYDLIAGQIFEDRNEHELPFVPSGHSQPRGKRFKDKAKHLKQQYPNLFEKYWN